MAKAPAFQFYPGDFLTGTTLMSNAEVGLFIRLLCLQAEHGSIPDDVERIVRAYGEEARELWTVVQPKFNRGSTKGTLVNERLCEVLAARDEFRRRQSEKGKASAAARASGSKRKKKQPRFNHGSTTVEPLEDGVIVLRKEEGRENLQWPPWAGEKCKAKWAEFKAYRKQLDRFTYKSTASEQAGINTLGRIYSRGEDMVQGLDEAMARGWKFPVDPKTKHNSTPSNGSGQRPQMSIGEVRAELNKIRSANGIEPGGVLLDNLIPDWLHKAMKTAK